MKFIIDYVSKNSGRLGNFVQHETGRKFPTPLLIQVTKGGSVPYLSRDVFDRVTDESQLIQISLATTIHMSEGIKHFQECRSGGLSEYIGFRGYPTMLMIRDPCEETPQGFNEKDTVPLFTRQGKQLLNAEKYMDLVEIFKPDFYQGLCDVGTNMESAKKRIRKSHDRTVQFMDYCYERDSLIENSSLLIPIVGGYCTYTRSLSIQHAISKTASSPDICGGYIFEGFHNYGLTATEINVQDQMVTVMKHCLSEINEAQRTNVKPTVLPGAYTPLMMLELIRLGIDILDTSYAYLAAINFKALAYTYDINREKNECIKAPAAFIDITNISYKDDFTPLLANCQCLTCKKHTKGYIHHLYVTFELLGPILLMIHNLHHMMQFFKVIQNIILQDRLDELIQLIKYQGGETEIDYSIKKHIRKEEKVGLGKKTAKR